ncbi:phospholipase D-like protein [Herminiimonas fonticola]|uniref:phospholipase D n=2 Tax=Herminiimonas fonticola TaxID=303380 RepID=A0A4R6GII5_9BURK|nr:PLD-like domain [Herminiimonas fonticola]TDN94786.1 phospholipase D-like protein [Herminiimonas fonticola]
MREPLKYRMKKILPLLSLLISISAYAKQPNLLDELSQVLQSRTTTAPATGLIESAFSPNAGAEKLVLKIINASNKSIRLAAYSFTSPAVTKALLMAKRRGVDVRVLVDENGNKGKASIAALNLLVNGSIPTRTISSYAIHHDKYIVPDEQHVQNGSFNYSQAAAKYNSENVLVVWNNPVLAASFQNHWQTRWVQGRNFRSAY